MHVDVIDGCEKNNKNTCKIDDIASKIGLETAHMWSLHYIHVHITLDIGHYCYNYYTFNVPFEVMLAGTVSTVDTISTAGAVDAVSIVGILLMLLVYYSVDDVDAVGILLILLMLLVYC